MNLKYYMNNLIRLSHLILVASILCIIASGAILYYLNKTQIDITILDPMEYKAGRWNLKVPIHAFYNNRGFLEFRENHLDGRYLSFVNDEEGAKKYNGIGFYGPFKMSEESLIQIKWRRNSGYIPFIEIQLIDIPPEELGYSTGEYYKVTLEPPGKTWKTETIPLKKFKQNSWQDPNGYVDGVLDLSRIRKMELGLPQHSEAVLDIKSIRVTQEAPDKLNVIMIMSLLVFPVFMFIRTRKVLRPDNDKDVRIFMGITRRISVLSLSVGLLFCTLFNPEIFMIPLLASGFILLMGLLFLFDIILIPFQKSFLFTLFWIALFTPLYISSPKLNPLVLGPVILVILNTAFPLLRRRRFLAATGLILTAVAAKDIIKIEGSYLLQYFSVIVVVLGGLSFMEFLITFNSRQEDSLSLNLYAGLLSYSPDGILTLNKQNLITGFNKGFQEWTGLEMKEEIVRKNISDFITSEEILSEEELNSQKVLRYDASVKSTDGTEKNVYVCRHPIYTQGEITGYQIIATDITERKKTELKLKETNKKLKEMANVDGLTNIYNRRFFDRQLEQEWRRGCRNNKPLSLILMDIDYFKNYNDTYGHIKGDECLVIVAEILKKNLKRAADFLARYGGEEFVIILPYTGEKDAYKVSELLRKKIEENGIEHKKSEIADILTVSVGVSTLFPDCRSGSAEELLENADKALYISKENGRNRTSILNKEE